MARDFDGATDRIDYVPTFAPGGVAQTIAIWCNPDDISTGNDKWFFIARDVSNNAAIWAGYSLGGGLGLFANMRFATGDLKRFSDDTEGFTTGSWQLIIITYDGTTTATGTHIYLDNVEVTYATSDNGSGAANSGDTIMTLGGNNAADNRGFNGQLAEYAIWDRVITAPERAILQAKYSAKFIPNGLRSYRPIVRSQKDV
ncbi:hypothetical protein LCGC14_2234040, partial [marine sediment metagenome]